MITGKFFIGILVLSVVLAGCARTLLSFVDEQQSSSSHQSISSVASSAASPVVEDPVQVIADHLAVPWDIAFLPSGDVLVTERTGKLTRIGSDRKSYTIEGVRHVGEGGLLGITLHPDFEDNHHLYLYLTTRSGEGLSNRVERYRFADDQLTDRTEIFRDIPGAQYHDGGRIAFGPDGFLYITTGDAGSSNLAQRTDSLAGKILRIRDDGSIPADNPFGNAVYSYGHRNPQGLTWDNRGRLWSTEHGRSGALSGYDELNLIEKGANYGWPQIEGPETRDGMRSPVLQSGSSDTWAPASALYHNGSIFWGGLRGEALYEAVISNAGGTPALKVHLLHQYGRIRTVQKGPDGFLFVTTSNQDGRGTPVADDDRIIRIDPKTLQ